MSSQRKIVFRDKRPDLRTYRPKQWRLDKERRKYWWVIWVEEPGRGMVHMPHGADYVEYASRKEAQVECDKLNTWWQEHGRIVAILEQPIEVTA